MISDGYTELAPGKLASIVTYVEMRERPAQADVSSSGVSLRRIQTPTLDWYRALFRRAGAQWLWFSRLELTDAQLTKVLLDPNIELFSPNARGSNRPTWKLRASRYFRRLAKDWVARL